MQTEKERARKREYMRKRRRENPDADRAYQQQWRAENPGYQSEWQRAKRRSFKKWALGIADMGACGCGETHPQALDFHHRDPSTKRFGITYGASKGHSVDEIIQEIRKCIVLCANCHRKHHYS